MTPRSLCLARWLLVMLVAASAAACGAATKPTPVPNETPVLIPGPQVNYNKVQLTIQTAVASSVTARVAPKGDAGPDAPFWASYPAHTEFVFNNYPVADGLNQASLEVYSVAESSQVNPTVATAMTDLTALLHGAPTLPTGKIPVLPVFNAQQVFQAQVKFADFKNGQGVRFVTQYAQGLTPINNHEVFYTYQGLTKDGAYYVAAVLPVRAALLAPDEEANSPVPAEGVLWPDLTSGDPAALFAGYVQAVTGKLNSTAPNQYTPALDALDAMMQSVEVK